MTYNPDYRVGLRPLTQSDILQCKMRKFNVIINSNNLTLKCFPPRSSRPDKTLEFYRDVNVSTENRIRESELSQGISFTPNIIWGSSEDTHLIFSFASNIYCILYNNLFHGPYSLRMPDKHESMMLFRGVAKKLTTGNYALVCHYNDARGIMGSCLIIIDPERHGFNLQISLLPLSSGYIWGFVEVDEKEMIFICGEDYYIHEETQYYITFGDSFAINTISKIGILTTIKSMLKFRPGELIIGTVYGKLEIRNKTDFYQGIKKRLDHGSHSIRSLIKLNTFLVSSDDYKLVLWHSPTFTPSHVINIEPIRLLTKNPSLKFGELKSEGDRLINCALNRCVVFNFQLEWSPENHTLYPKEVKGSIKVFLLILTKIGAHRVFPRGMVSLVCGWVINFTNLEGSRERILKLNSESKKKGHEEFHFSASSLNQNIQFPNLH